MTCSQLLFVIFSCVKVMLQITSSGVLYTSLQMPFPRSENLKRSLPYDGARLRNPLPLDLRNSDS